MLSPRSATVLEQVTRPNDDISKITHKNYKDVRGRPTLTLARYRSHVAIMYKSRATAATKLMMISCIGVRPQSRDKTAL
jgi:hypothetical protein